MKCPFQILILAVVLFWTQGVFCASIAKEYDQGFTTYPYSDADPVPSMSKFYPYFRYDGFTDKPVQKKWSVVELENDYLQLLILPEIGGKVWAAIERSTGRPFIYYNHVIKFRDVSMRGPWTSGGMEANYGIMGHTPNCFSSVDYLVRTNSDGSASCFIGVLDLLTRTTWQLEINLPSDQACFSTRSVWHNSSGLDEPYYSWMNVGVKAAGNLQFINPGTRYLGHDGKAFDWPINLENHRDLSWYVQNNFGSYKSYHVFGKPSEFWGAYWHDDDFGMARCSSYADKPGRKIWIWGLSREGMIWEKLLTDSDGQYVEVQSGRLFNQTDETSTLTPFKHKEFAPYATDTWTEYWYPVKGMGGFVAASPWGAMNVHTNGNLLSVSICPVRPLQGKLRVQVRERVVAERNVDLKPMQVHEEQFTITNDIQEARITLGGDKLSYSMTADDALSRPLQMPTNFNWNSAYGLYLQGKENARERLYPKAQQSFQACLAKDPNFAPALVEMASLQNRRGQWNEAREFARHALSIDTYAPGANYQFGMASAALGRQADAEDAFSVAALSSEWRSAADCELAKVFLRQKKLEHALVAADESLAEDPRNLDSLQLKICIQRLRGETAAAEAALADLMSLAPLNHFARFEQYLLGKARAEDFTSMIRNELPQETYLEIGSWYHSIGLEREAIKVLELAPQRAEVLYWLAFLQQDVRLLKTAEAASAEFVFPFRTESAAVFEWAMKQSSAWQTRYYLALLRWFQGDERRAADLLKSCGNTPEFAPFYAARAQLCPELAAVDLERAGHLDEGQWRYGLMLARLKLKENNAGEALRVSTEYAQRFPSNGALAVLHAKALLACGKHQEASALLNTLEVLPSEGSTEAHALFREANLMLAIDEVKSGEYERALGLIDRAREWPERLGAGKPYPEDVDERLEDWVAYRCHQRMKRESEAGRDLERILAKGTRGGRLTAGEIIYALALGASGRRGEAEAMAERWVKEQADKPLAAWGRELVMNRQSPLPPGEGDSGCRVLAASLFINKSDTTH